MQKLLDEIIEVLNYYMGYRIIIGEEEIATTYSANTVGAV